MDLGCDDRTTADRLVARYSSTYSSSRTRGIQTLSSVTWYGEDFLVKVLSTYYTYITLAGSYLPCHCCRGVGTGLPARRPACHDPAAVGMHPSKRAADTWCCEPALGMADERSNTSRLALKGEHSGVGRVAR